MSIRLVRITGLLLALTAWLTAGEPALAQQQMIHLRVQLGDVDITKIVGVVAYEEGIYKKNGLDVEQFISQSAAAITKRRGVTVPEQYVRNTDAPIAIGGGMPLMFSKTTNAMALDRVILASFDHVVHWHIMARPGLHKLEDLKGKRLGILGVGDMTHFLALAVAEKMGWDPRLDLSLLTQGSALDSLQSGAVDAIVASEVPQATALAAGFHSLVDTRPWRVPIPGSGVTSTRTWVKNNREAARRFLKSILEAMALLKRDKNAAFRGMAKWFNVTDREQQQLIYDGNREMPIKPYPAVDGIKKTMQLSGIRILYGHSRPRQDRSCRIMDPSQDRGGGYLGKGSLN